MEKSCGIYIVNKNNELLIVHPTQSPINKNWGIPKGKMEDGETHFETAIRELKEETNLSLVGVENYCIELPESVYKSKRKTLYSYFINERENPRVFSPWDESEFNMGVLKICL
jgi:bis(5'-nucleosidyl)-tetraphosphatase